MDRRALGTLRAGRPRLDRVLITLLAVTTAVALAAACSDEPDEVADQVADPQVTDGSRPNIVLFLTDDQRWDSLDAMPQLNAAPEWAHFANAFVELPQCCPSRATILTGRYSQSTGVETLRDGGTLDEERTVATLLRDAGYRTAHFGKYLNGYPFGRGHYVPPGWDEFASYEGGTNYFDYSLNDNGTLTEYGSEPDDYSTDVFAARAMEFIASTEASQPVFLQVSFNAPHRGTRSDAAPAARHRGSCADHRFELPMAFNASDSTSEPPWMRAETGPRPEGMVRERQATCETLMGVDEAVAAVIAELERAGRLDDSYLIFTSDNGYAFGEHRLVGKGDLYEESIRVPLLVRGPDVEPGPVDRLTSNVDLVPTMLEWADVEPPANFLDGSSFAAAVRGEASGPGPQEVLLRGCRTARGADQVCGGYPSDMPTAWGVRTATHKYVEYPDGYVQLFDLTTDPSEMTNLAPDPAYAGVLADLRERLVLLRDG